MTVDKKFASQIKNIVRNEDDVFLELTLIDVSTEHDTYINDVLVNEGRALKS